MDACKSQSSLDVSPLVSVFRQFPHCFHCLFFCCFSFKEHAEAITCWMGQLVCALLREKVSSGIREASNIALAFSLVHFPFPLFTLERLAGTCLSMSCVSVGKVAGRREENGCKVTESRQEISLETTLHKHTTV